MYRHPSEIYLETMERAFFETTPASYEPPTDKPLENHLILSSNEYRSAYIDTIRSFDWDEINTQFHTRDMDSPDGDDDNRSPQEYVEGLTTVAFDEARTLIELSLDVMPEEVVRDPLEVQATLKASKGNLLRAARMIDDDKSILLLFSKDRDPSLRRNNISLLFSEIGMLPALQFTNGRVEWRSEVQAWMERRIKATPGAGCPAHKEIVEIDGKKMTLINAFFDRMVDHCFGNLSAADYTASFSRSSSSSSASGTGSIATSAVLDC